MPDAPFTPKPTVAVEHTHQLWQARFSPCGKQLCAAGYDGLVHRWEVRGPELVKLAPLAGHHGWVQGLDFHPQGNVLFTSDSWGQLVAWRYLEESPQPIWNCPETHAGWIHDLAVSPNGELLASCGRDGLVRLWTSADGAARMELVGHQKKVLSVAFHPDGKSLVSGDLLGVIKQWDLGTGKEVREFNAKTLYQLDKIQECGGARRLTFNASGDTLLCAGMKSPGGGFAVGAPSVLVFDWASAARKQELLVGGKDDGFAYDARFHPAGFVMGTSCAMPGKGHLWFWRPGEDKPFFVGTAMPNGRSLSLHPDGRLAMLSTISQNANGRSLEGGMYKGGHSKIQVFQLGTG